MKKGLYFHIHADGAYGAYFMTMLNKVKKGQINPLSSYATRQFSKLKDVDSITFDPHKTGYLPVGCGGIIYKDYRLRSTMNHYGDYIYDGK